MALVAGGGRDAGRQVFSEEVVEAGQVRDDRKWVYSLDGSTVGTQVWNIQVREGAGLWASPMWMLGGALVSLHS